MKIRISLLILTVLISTQSHSQTQTIHTINDCRQIATDQKRLACYDHFAKQSGPSTPAADASVTAAGAPTAQHKAFSGLPGDDPFPRLVAAPKEQKFFVTLARADADFASDEFSAAFVGYGDSLGLVRWAPDPDGGFWQLNMFGGLFAQFDIDELGDSQGGDLLNADYTVGFSTTYMVDDFALRLSLFHESTHLGDELLIENPQFQEQRINYSYEAVDVLAAMQRDSWRLYSGFRYLLRREPESLDRWQYQIGAEYLSDTERLWGSKIVAGLDIRALQENDWEPAISFKGGLHFASTSSENYIRVMLEAFDGPSPYGQFFNQDIRYLGIGTYLGF